MEARLATGATRYRLATAEWLTVERVAYGVVVLTALAVRLIGLGWRALDPVESTQALSAWGAATGQAYDLVGGSPLLFGLQRLLFTALGGHEMWARWWPALLGGLTPLLFYPLRDRLTRGGALIAALLWTLSPLAILGSRLGLGYGLTPPLALALMGAVNGFARRKGQAHDADAPRSLVLAAVALGLLLTAGLGAYTVVLWTLIAAALWRDQLPGLWRTIGGARRTLLLGFFVPLFLAATFFLSEPRGLAATADLLGRWFRGLTPGAGYYSAGDTLQQLLLGEPLLIGLGIAGLVYALRYRDRFGLYGALAATVALLIPLIGHGRHPGDLALVVLALTLLAGPAAARALRHAWPLRTHSDPWLLVGLSLALLTTASLCLPSAANTSNQADWRQVFTIVGIATTVLTIVVWLVYGFWGSWRTVVHGLPVVFLVFGLAWGIARISGLNFGRGAWRQPAALVNTPAAALDDLLSDLEALAALNGTGTREADVDLILPVNPDDPLSPTLRWVLRDFKGLRVLRGLPADPAALVITEAGEQPALSERYGGADYTVLQTWRPQGLPGFEAKLRWVLYGEAKTPVQTRAVVLWVDRSEP